MSTSKTAIGGTRRSAALGLFTTTSLALFLLVVGGAWSSARAAGPALWIATPSSGSPGALGGLVELRPHQLLASGTPTQVQIEQSIEPLANASGLAFQDNGSLWVCTLNNTVLKFTAGQLQNLAAVPHPAPRVTITSSSFGFNIGCVLDAHGNLWVVDSMNDAVHEISRAQLVAATVAGGTSNITPQVTITDSTDLTSPSFAAFDSAGNIWVSSLSNSEMVEFSASQLSTGGTQTGHVVISGASLNGPGQPQFDAAGNMWVTNSGNDTVVKFTPAQLAASGSPTAAAIIGDDGSGTSLVTPWGCTFDSLGRLWVFNYGTATSTTTTISMYGRGMVAASGSTHPTPRITLDGLQPFAAQLTFGPRY
jgi:sugar lactone lactonase YvrE